MPRANTLTKIAQEQGKTEEQVIEEALNKAGGKIDRAATSLGMWPSWFRFEIERRDLDIVREVKVTLVKRTTS